MADNTVLNPGAGGDTYASDDIGGVKHQRVKVEWGADGSATEVANVAGSRLPVEPGDDNPITLNSSQVSGIANATTTRTTTTGLGKYTSIFILIRFTNAGAATGTLQLFLQDSVDGGTTWDDLVASNTFAFGAALTNQNFAIQGQVATSKTPGSAAQVEALAAGQTRQGPFGDRIRVREVVSGVSGSPTGVTYVITAVFKR